MPSSASSSPHQKLDNKLTKKSLRNPFGPNPNARLSLESQLDFERDGEVVHLNTESPAYGNFPDNQHAFNMHRSEILQRPAAAPTRRTPLRLDAQDGPWSVSVAESPHDPRSYSLYIKTPTHHITLMRSSSEIHSLHSKLRDSYPSLAIPSLPLDSSDPSVTNGKRRSSFLNTLSRLASPGPKPRNMPTQPMTLPKDMQDDPFVTSPQSVTTGLAAYLTTLSNDQIIRVSKHWRRFVRVRTDDLESVRVERAIKRVRSDVAMHAASGSHTLIGISSSLNPSVPVLEAEQLVGTDSLSRVAVTEGEHTQPVEDSLLRDDSPLSPQVAEVETVIQPTLTSVEDKSLLEDENTAAAAAMATATPTVTPSTSPIVPKPPLSPCPESDADALEQEEPASVSTSPSSSPQPPAPKQLPHALHRIPRSASADPDKATRLSRVFKSSAIGGAETDDDSVSKPDKKHSGDLPKKSKRKVVIDDFEMMRVLGKGCAGKVLLVKHKASSDMYALKAITKRHVLAHQELQHTLTEQAVLKRMAREGADPFVVKLWWSFHDKENLFLVMDFHPGGDLATQLARWGRLGRDRARFYAAEIVEGVEGLHAAGVIYRDLKPENILIGVDGHIVLTDFGLSKEFPRGNNEIAPLPTAPNTPSSSRDEYYSASDISTPVTPYWMKGESGSHPWYNAHANDVTSTFCGTAEYLAPEVIQGLPYGYEVDWWSFGTMLYEMLTGITPFWANNHSDMYVRVLQDELQFPEDKAMDQDTRSLIRGLLQRNPALRIKEPRLKRHPYFSMIDWGHVYHKRYIPPYIPPIDSANPSDTQNFDDAFLDMDPILDTDPDPELQTTDSERERTDDDRTDGEDSVRTPAQSRSPSVHPIEDGLFDGYSFKGRHSVLIDDGEDDGYESPTEEHDEGDDEHPATIASESVEEIIEEEEEEENEDEESPESKTPEAKPSPLPQLVEDEKEDEGSVDSSAKDEVAIDIVEQEAASKDEDEITTELPQVYLADTSEVLLHLAPLESIAANLDHASSPAITPVSGQNVATRLPRTRREKSGVAALDRRLSDAIVSETENEAPIKEDDDDDWDLVEAPGMEDRNGAKGTTLFARGVVDRYRLAVFRKASTARPKRPSRYFSGHSTDAEFDGPDNSTISPSPSEKVRRGRNPGLSFKTPKQFLRARSPPSTLSASTSATSRASLAKSSATISGSTSMSKTTPSISLKSKPSAASVSAPTTSTSDQSLSHSVTEFGTGSNVAPRSPSAVQASISGDDQPSSKIKKMKKNYKEGAEKVLSLFGSPRP